MHEDDPLPKGHIAPANDNAPLLRSAKVDAALTRIAEAIGRHVAREHIRARKAANDNEPGGRNPSPLKR
ncbi:hypothetical protein ATE68_05635 [Sphingopyxis sp. H038]|uniref:hypothetical protein n=1 Tax=unclassified Sphingopyxis TaxID=2614943 RepID=UPI0007319B01|nr:MULTISPECIES: hypothetical protein [unclassified Sphingopyxis]KTD99962.1 hypothetical protein ATE78_20620 [Sphingopyxis sp. H012]KTE07148.1 hypothetical protein ATE70_20600 [Sphingopyxis sp. H053]KTE09026.1 hypothetical protein ATE76_14810 [Sphingopyxis sp. H093]KTE25303.1 hypothetical protein ATE75_16680 [Sphingopyxis sp. H080]KTE36326.1 hypothetical protein ATE68_05635 [Sphingopyxis sp. H038]